MRSLASLDFCHQVEFDSFFTTRVDTRIVPVILRFNHKRFNTIRFLCLSPELHLLVRIRQTCRECFQKSSNLGTKRIVRKESFCATGSIYLAPFLLRI